MELIENSKELNEISCQPFIDDYVKIRISKIDKEMSEIESSYSPVSVIFPTPLENSCP
jgi:hypothetical protein